MLSTMFVYIPKERYKITVSTLRTLLHASKTLSDLRYCAVQVA
jgi:hypothetical protein